MKVTVYVDITVAMIVWILDVAVIVSVWILVAISVERFIVIRHPLRAKDLCTRKKARIICTILWIMGIFNPR
jgi:hypothetical protein